MEEKIINLPAFVCETADGRAFITKKLSAKRPRRTIPDLFAILVVITMTIIAICYVTLTPSPGHREVVDVPKVIEVPISVSDRIAWEITSEEEELVARVVAAMARGEDNLTQQAVAQSIRNTCEMKNMTVEEAIEWGRYPVYTGDVPASCKGVTQKVMEGYNAVDDILLYCYNPDTQSGEWHESQEFVAQVGSLRFFH